MRLSIIIVNYNVTDEIRTCITSIIKLNLGFKYEIIVVDNNSEDDSIKNIKKEFPYINLEILDKNIGYGPANNHGFQISRGENVLILNPDTYFVEDCITPLLDFLEKNLFAGALTPMLVYQDGTFQYSFGLNRGVLVEYLDAFYVLNGLYEKATMKKLNRLISTNVPFEVGWISGAFMLMRREVFESVGGFSTEYKLNYEDMDLCFKIKHNNYKIYYFPQFRCVHLESISQRKDFYNYIYFRYKGKFLFLSKYFSGFHFHLLRFLHLIGLFMRYILSFFVFKGNEGITRRKAFYDSMFLCLNFKRISRDT